MMNIKNVIKSITIAAFSMVAALVLSIMLGSSTAQAAGPYVHIDNIYGEYGGFIVNGTTSADVFAVSVQVKDVHGDIVAMSSGPVKDCWFDVRNIGLGLPNGFYTVVVTDYDYENTGASDSKTFTLDLKPKMAYASLVLDGRIGIKIYLGIPSNCSRVIVNGETHAPEDFVLSSDGYRVINYYVDAQNIDEKLVIDIPEDDELEIIGNGQTVNLISYSVRDYINSVYKLYAESDENKLRYQGLYDFCRAIDTYGYAADNYFNGSDDGAELLAELDSNREVNKMIERADLVVQDAQGGAEFIGHSLVLNDTLSARIYFRYDGNVPGAEGELVSNNFVLNIDDSYIDWDNKGQYKGNNYGACIVKVAEGLYYLEISNIRYNDVAWEHVIAISAAEDSKRREDIEPDLVLQNYSVMSYCKALNDVYETDDTQVSKAKIRLWKALCNLNIQMYNYFY